MIEDTILVTRGVKENTDIRLVMKIMLILRKKEATEEELDYFQIFETDGANLINTQEVPELKEEYQLSWKNKKEKLWAIKDHTNWTIMYPDEY